MLSTDLENDYSGGFWAICPDFEIHHSREWEPAKFSDFGLIIVSVRKALVKAANAPLMRLRPWQALFCQITNNQAKS